MGTTVLYHHLKYYHIRSTKQKATYKATTKQKGYILSNNKTTMLHIKQQQNKKATYKATTKQKGYI